MTPWYVNNFDVRQNIRRQWNVFCRTKHKDDTKRTHTTLQVIVALRYKLLILKDHDDGFQTWKPGCRTCIYRWETRLRLRYSQKRVLTSNIVGQKNDITRVHVTFQVIVAFQYEFLIVKDLENGFQGWRVGSLIFIRCSNESILSIHGRAQVLTSNFTCQNIDWERMSITY